MTMADVGFFEQIEIGPAYPVSETPARDRLSSLPNVSVLLECALPLN